MKNIKEFSDREIQEGIYMYVKETEKNTRKTESLIELAFWFILIVIAVRIIFAWGVLSQF